MNAARLRQLIDELLEKEQTGRIQKRLNAANSALQNLANNPQQSEAQIQAAKALDELRAVITEFDDQLDPAEHARLAEIGGSPFFTGDLVEGIEEIVRENPMTPAVAQQYVAKLAGDRDAYLNVIKALSASMKSLGIEAEAIEETDAEIGFTIPRAIFDNELDGLIKELRAIKQIIRAFSELATGSAQPINVRQISTSDPVFFFGLDVVTVLQIAGAVTWALNTWKQVEDIRKLRADTAKNKSFTPKEVEDFFGEKIRKTINEAIDAKLTPMLEDDGKAGRQKEQRTDLKMALESLLARIERGLRVEIRVLPPPKVPGGGDEPVVPEKPEFAELREIATQLTFPEPDSEPIMELPPPPAEPSDKKRKAGES